MFCRCARHSVRIWALAVLFCTPFLTVGAEENPLAPAPSVAPVPALPSELVEIERMADSGDSRGAWHRVDAWQSREKKSPWPWVAEARLAFREKKYKRSLKASEKALKRDGSSAEAYYWRGRSYEALNRPLDAANEYQAATMASHGFPKAKEAYERVEAELKAPGESAGEGSATH